MNTYLVWQSGHKPEMGTLVEAESSFEARKRIAVIRILDVTDVMARRVNSDDFPFWEISPSASGTVEQHTAIDSKLIVSRSFLSRSKDYHWTVYGKGISRIAEGKAANLGAAKAKAIAAYHKAA